MNNNIKKIFFFIAIIGWILGLTAHLLSFTGYTSPTFWLLHIGVFVVWFPAMICLVKETGKSMPELLNYFKSISAPKWLKIIVAVCFIYAFINFVLFASSFQISDEDSDMLRGFSGHWMAFYGMATLILYPFGKGNNKKDGSATYVKNYK